MGQAEIYLSDNSGNRVAHPKTVNPVAGSGIALAGGTAGSDVTQAVTAGQLYAITIPIGAGTWLFSITGVTSAAANREWIACAGDTIILRIPKTASTLYFECDTESKTAYMVKLA